MAIDNDDLRGENFMTAEISIMNREAIALATDSAVTSSPKIFNSANKLFCLSKYHPVGIMIYGSAILMDIPWETIIKMYRQQLGKNNFPTLKEHANDFIKYIENNNIISKEQQDNYLSHCIKSYLLMIRDEIKKKIKQVIDKNGRITEREVKSIYNNIIKSFYDQIKKADKIIYVTNYKKLIASYNDLIKEHIKIIFEDSPITNTQVKQLLFIGSQSFIKFPIRNHRGSGVVIAGFGEKETFPSLISYSIDGLAFDKLKYQILHDINIGPQNSSSIIPFAQTEMVRTFMEGMDPFLQQVENSYIEKLFGSVTKIIIDKMDKYTSDEKKEITKNINEVIVKLVDERKEHMNEYMFNNYIAPIVNVVAILPKDELAAMAESLVTLTSLKRKVTPNEETVGGPIDVAVISKGDGFIWIKRKHYFDGNLNPQHFNKYFMEVKHG